jgi:hypothetical protein
MGCPLPLLCDAATVETAGSSPLSWNVVPLRQPCPARRHARDSAAPRNEMAGAQAVTPPSWAASPSSTGMQPARAARPHVQRGVAHIYQHAGPAAGERPRAISNGAAFGLSARRRRRRPACRTAPPAEMRTSARSSGPALLDTNASGSGPQPVQHRGHSRHGPARPAAWRETRVEEVPRPFHSAPKQRGEAVAQRLAGRDSTVSRSHSGRPKARTQRSARLDGCPSHPPACCPSRTG